MNTILNLCAIGAMGLTLMAGCQKNSAPAAAGAPVVNKNTIYASYGQAVSAEGDAIPAAKMLGDVPAYEGKPVRVAGTVSKVCERKGCWLEMTDGSEKLFVKFTCPIDGRLIPMEAIGKPAIVEGQLAVKEISEEDARHLAEEGGKTPEQVAKIVGPQKQVTLKSPGALVFGIAK